MELPQINPEIGVQPQRVVGGIGQAGAGLREAAEAFKEVDRQAGLLMNWQARQDVANHYASGEADYIIGSTKIFDDARGIQDPNVKMKAISDGLGALRSQIIKDNPQAADKLTEQLGIRYADDLHKATQQGIELSDKNNKANLDLTLEKSVLAASATTDDRDRALADHRVQGVLNQYVSTGGLTQGEADKKYFDFRYNLAKSDFGVLAQTDPKAALAMPLEKTGFVLNGQHYPLKYEDYDGIQRGANAHDNRQNSEGERAWKDKRDQAISATMSGAAPDAQVEQFYKDGLIGEDMYKMRLHHLPSNGGVLSHETNTIDNWQGSADELARYSHTHIATNSYLEPFDRNAAMGIAAEKVNELRSEEGRSAQLYKINLQEALIKAHPELYQSLTNPLAADAKALNKRVDAFGVALKGKSPDEQQKIFDKALEELNKNTVPTTKVVPSAAPPTGTGFMGD